MAAKIVVVFGAAGFVGRHVVRELANRGWRVRAAVRNPHHAHFLRPLGRVGQIDIVQANIRYRQSVAEALKGAHAVVNLAAILSPAGQQSFDAVHATGARHIAEMAARAGIKSLVHVSAIGANPRAESHYARTKGAGETAMREAMPGAVILRPSIIFGPQDSFFNRFGAMAQMSPFLPLIGGGKTKFQPVFVDDVAEAVAIGLERPQLAGRTYELGGPEVMSFRELMVLMLKVIGRRRGLIPLPFVIAGGMGAVGDMLSILPFVEAPITADQVKLLRKDNIVGISGEDTGTLADFGITPRSMASILPSYLVRFRKRGQFSPEVPV